MLGLLLAPPSFGQAVETDRFNRTLEQLQRSQRLEANPSIPIGQRALIDYGGFVTGQWLSLDDPRNHNHAFYQEDLVGYAHVVFDGAQETFFRGRLYHRDFNAGDRFDSNGENVDGRIERLFYRFDLASVQAAYGGRKADFDIAMKFGRDLIYWGNGLTLNSEVDAVTLDLSHGPYSLQLIAGITPLDTVDFDTSRPQFESHTKRGLYGGYGSVKVGQQRPFFYVLNQRDYNSDNLAADDPDNTSGIPTRFNYDSYYIGVGSTGTITDRLSYGIEGVYEGGHTLSASQNIDAGGNAVALSQARDRIEAYALDGRLDYALTDVHQTRLSFETILATGDSDRGETTNTVNGNRANSRDHAFNGLGLLNTGVALAPPVSNLICLRLGASTFPLSDTQLARRLQIGTDLFWLGKLDSKGPIDEPTNDSTYLGWEPDVYLNWALASDVTLALRYGVFVPGDAIIDRQARQFFYSAITFAF